MTALETLELGLILAGIVVLVYAVGFMILAANRNSPPSWLREYARERGYTIGSLRQFGFPAHLLDSRRWLRGGKLWWLIGGAVADGRQAWAACYRVELYKPLPGIFAAPLRRQQYGFAAVALADSDGALPTLLARPQLSVFFSGTASRQIGRGLGNVEQPPLPDGWLLAAGAGVEPATIERLLSRDFAAWFATWLPAAGLADFGWFLHGRWLGIVADEWREDPAWLDGLFGAAVSMADHLAAAGVPAGES